MESGNPAGSARCLPMLERYREHYGKSPAHAAFDGGYASADSLERAREMGVAHAVFSKKRGPKEEDMTSSPWIFDRLRRFRAGVKAGTSLLKCCFGLARLGALQGLGAIRHVRAQSGADCGKSALPALPRRDSNEIDERKIDQKTEFTDKNQLVVDLSFRLFPFSDFFDQNTLLDLE